MIVRSKFITNTLRGIAHQSCTDNYKVYNYKHEWSNVYAPVISSNDFLNVYQSSEYLSSQGGTCGL